jgi:pimeloyl-ACP methyl ester carboxylesterase
MSKPSPLHRPGLRPLAWRALALPTLLALSVATSGCGRHNVLAPDGLPPGVQGAAHAAVARATGLAAFTEPLHLQGTSESGALWAIDRPADWNGDLVVYLHGYVDPAQPLFLPDYGAIRDSLMARGYAVAASSYSSNGYAVAEGARDSRELSGLFADRVGRPRRTYLLGKSLGGLVGLLLTQKFPQQYDGSLLVSGIVGGSQEEVQYMGDIRVLFDAVYHRPLPGDLYHPPVITDLNAQVVQPVMRAIMANPQGVGVIQALARRPLPGASTDEIVTSLVTMIGFTAQEAGDLFARAHGHSFFDNAGYHYDSPALPAAVVDDINARVDRFTREPDANAYLLHYGAPQGPFRIPVLTMHTSRDPVVPAFHEDLLASVATGPNLRQELVPGYGHATFSAAEIMARFAMLVKWVEERGTLVCADGTMPLAH